MKIIKYKYLNNSKYKIYLEQDEIELYEDIIINYNILNKKELSKEEIDNLLKENNYYDLYYKSIKYIKAKLRTKKEIHKYLEKYNASLKDIKSIIEKLEKDGYINDELYAKSYIHDSIILKLDGPLKIKKHLLDEGISNDIVIEELKEFDDELIDEKIEKYITKSLKQNKNKSLYALKQKLIYNLINLGYEKDNILNHIENINYSDEELKEKEYDKLYKKLSNKYSGKELEFKIKQKLYEKGFR